MSSLDIRLTAVNDFVDGYVGKGRMGAEFKPGGKFGYHEKSIKKSMLDSSSKKS